MEYHEAGAWFELGRRWVIAHFACANPPSPVKHRQHTFDEFRRMATMLSLPIDDIVTGPGRSPKKFFAEGEDRFSKMVIVAKITSGARGAELMQIGAAYLSTLVTKSTPKKANEARSELGVAMGTLGVAAKDRRRLLKDHKLQWENPKKTSQAEGDLARRFAECLADAVVASSGIQVGDETLPNSIVVPNKGRIVLPKRLVGFRSDIERFLKKHPFDRNIFLMMPFRDATKLLRTKIRAVCGKYKLFLVIADEQRIVENDLNGNVLSCLLASKFGMAVFSKPEAKQTINPNVAYELGMMHRDDKVCLILKDRALKSLPTDLIGYLYVDYSPSDGQSIVTRVETWISDRIL